MGEVRYIKDEYKDVPPVVDKINRVKETIVMGFILVTAVWVAVKILEDKDGSQASHT